MSGTSEEESLNIHPNSELSHLRKRKKQVERYNLSQHTAIIPATRYFHTSVHLLLQSYHPKVQLLSDFLEVPKLPALPFAATYAFPLVGDKNATYAFPHVESRVKCTF